MLRGAVPPVVEDETGFFPPLGLLYVAAHARTVSEVNVSLLDCEAQCVDYDTLDQVIRDHRPDLIGVQVMTFTLLDAIKTAEAAKRVAPSCPIVFGGPHATIFPSETISLPQVDYVIQGEGEYPFAALVEALRDHRPVHDIAGVLTKDRPVEAFGLKHIEDLDALKSPARDLLPIEVYRSAMARRNPVTTMMSSRGCPGQCTFCDRPQMGKIFRKRSAQSVVDEMEHCVRDLGIREIVFYDDTFTIDQRRVLEICDLIQRRGLRACWDIRARADTMTPEMLAALRRAGCYRIHYGVESGSPSTQKRIQKHLNLDRVREVFAATRKVGIETLGYFMIGLPGETERELRQTLDLMCSLKMDYAHIAMLTPYPGTRIYATGLADGVYDRDFWREYAKNPTPDFTPLSWTEHFTQDELQTHLRDAYRRFYFRPRYVLQRAVRVRSLRELLSKAGLGFKMFRGMLSSKPKTEGRGDE
jgi:radical SAM superfamily enzyme YgiQ (UPF0313 family)